MEITRRSHIKYAARKEIDRRKEKKTPTSRSIIPEIAFAGLAGGTCSLAPQTGDALAGLK